MSVILPVVLGVLAMQGPDEWRPWSARPNLMPETRHEDGRWIAASTGEPSCHGGWDLVWKTVAPGRWYRAEITAKPGNLPNLHDSAHVELLWWGGKGKRPLDWTHVRFTPTASGEVLFRTRHRAPEGATRATLRLMLRWTNRGRVAWREASLTPVKAPPPRTLKVAIATGKFPGTSVKDNLDFALKLIDQAADAGAKVVCLPETLTSWGVDDKDEGARPIPGKVTDALCAKARERKIDIVGSMNELNGKLIHNTGLYIDAKKGIVGKYRKVHLAVGERWSGITPGKDFPVWPTGYGTAGMLICYDNVMPQGHQILAQKGAEVIFLPIMGDPRARGEKAYEKWLQIMKVRAMDNHVWMVVCQNRGEWGCIIRPDGELVAKVESSSGIAVAELDLNFRYRSWIGSDFENRYWGERRPHLYKELSEDR